MIFHDLKDTGPLKLNTDKNWPLEGGELVAHPPDCLTGVHVVVLQGVILGNDIHHERRFCERVGGGGAGCRRESRTSHQVWCGPMSQGRNGSTILGPRDSRRRGGTAADGAGGQGRGEIDVVRLEFLELDASIGLCSWQGRELPRPPRPRSPSGPPRWPGPPPPRPRQGRVTGIIICSTLKPRGGSNATDLCVFPSYLLPKTLLTGISTKLPILQPKKIFTPLEGIFLTFWGQRSFQRGKKFNCLVICSIFPA
jgi:hypothetical protein